MAAPARNAIDTNEEEPSGALNQERSIRNRPLDQLTPDGSVPAARSDDRADESQVVTDSVQAAQEQIEHLTSFYSDAFLRGDVDAAWSAAVTQELSRSAMEPGMQGTQVSDARCQSTQCRIEAVHDSVESKENFLLQLAQLDAFHDGEAFAVPTDRGDGSIATTIFISRSGYHLPQPN